MKNNNHSFLKTNNMLKCVPNTLTVCNSLFGFAAILTTLQAYKVTKDPGKVFVISACMILIAMVFDALDGFAARLLNATSLKGVQMDSLSDMVTFGVAPAVLVAVMAHLYSITFYGYWLAWLLAAIYLACGAHRLAKYNVLTMIEKKSDDKFDGLPIPGAAAAICTLVFFFGEYDSGHQLVRLLPFYVCILGFLMVSKVKYTHIGKWLVKVKNSRKRQIILIVVIICLIISPAIVAVILVNGYVIWGIVSSILNYRSNKEIHE